MGVLDRHGRRVLDDEPRVRPERVVGAEDAARAGPAVPGLHGTAAYCPRCGTGLSDAEVALGYTQIDDPSIYVRVPGADGRRRAWSARRSSAWTTMPWTLSPPRRWRWSATRPYVRARGRPSPRTDRRAGVAAWTTLRRVAGGDRDVRLEELVGARYRSARDYEAPVSRTIDGRRPRILAFVAAGLRRDRRGHGDRPHRRRRSARTTSRSGRRERRGRR